MANNFFGYKLSPSSTMKIDGVEDKKFTLLKVEEPDVLICMACGSCAGSCTAGVFTTMNLRRIILFLQRGKTESAINQVNHCMFCGKCNLVCPRGINTRRLLLKIQEIYKGEQK